MIHMLSTGLMMRIGSTDNMTPCCGGTDPQKRATLRLIFPVYIPPLSSYSEQAFAVKARNCRPSILTIEMLTGRGNMRAVAG
jgi:hypothetical protein